MTERISFNQEHETLRRYDHIIMLSKLTEGTFVDEEEEPERYANRVNGFSVFQPSCRRDSEFEADDICDAHSVNAQSS